MEKRQVNQISEMSESGDLDARVNGIPGSVTTAQPGNGSFLHSKRLSFIPFDFSSLKKMLVY
jgi:hypothetical protein